MLLSHSHSLGAPGTSPSTTVDAFSADEIIGAGVSEPHTSEFNCNFSYDITIIICCTSFRISLML